MAARGRRCLGVKWRFLAELSRVVRSGYPDAPLDRPRELAAFIAACGPFVEGVAGRPVRIVRGYLVETAMGPAWWPVLPLGTVGELERLLDLRPQELAWFADTRSWERSVTAEPLRHYRYRWIAKPGGGVRLLEMPKPRLREFQRRLLRQALDAIPVHEAAHGFRAGRSAVTHAREHVGRPVLLRFDLEGFFASVGAGRVFGIFRSAGYPEPVAYLLTGLTTNVVPLDVWRAAPPPAPDWRLPTHHRLGRRLATPHLPQGAPTSPAVANLAASGLDRRLAGLARRLGLTYSRCADDLAFSGGGHLVRLAGGVERAVAQIARDEGFRVNEAKTGLSTAAGRQHLCGVVVNRRPNVARPDYDRLRAVLHNCVRDGPEAHNRGGHADFRAHLQGKVAWVASVNPERGRRLRATFDRIAW